jgi:histone arginine demethylase JMJD6
VSGEGAKGTEEGYLYYQEEGSYRYRAIIIMGWRKKMKDAQRRHRPSLKDWERDGLFDKFPDFVASLSSPEEQYRSFVLRAEPLNHQHNQNHKQHHQQQMQEDGEPRHQGRSLSPSSVVTETPPPPPQQQQRQQLHIQRGPQGIPAILEGQFLTPEDFAINYEAKEIPAVIRGIPFGLEGGSHNSGTDDAAAGGGWSAVRRWPLGSLKRCEDLQDRHFKCGEDDDGKSVKVKLRHFLKYLRSNRDDSPLYIFDSAFDDDRHAKSILDDYRVPVYFRDDLFRLVKESRRPPYRWFLVGPERSGTCVHLDPLATNAWNTLIEGQKRWVLFPPHVPKHVVKGKGLIGKNEDDEAIHYFMYILPRIKRRAEELKDRHLDYRDFACYEFTQHAGETVFVPNGWWHAVLNLTHTVGVTQNYCSPRNFDKVWIKSRTGRKRMAWKWLLALEGQYPDLAHRAREMNRRDQFRMKYDPAEMARRRREESSLSASPSSSRQAKQQKVI